MKKEKVCTSQDEFDEALRELLSLASVGAMEECRPEELVYDLEQTINNYIDEHVDDYVLRASQYTVVETPTKTEFPTGAHRSSDEDKPKLASLPWDMFPRLSFHYEKGAKIYGDNNWRKGMLSSHVLNSLMRHVQQYRVGDRKEDHLSAIIFNAFCLMFNEENFDKEVHDLE